MNWLRAIVSVCLLAPFSFAACADDGDSASPDLAHAAAECEVLGELCHGVGDDDGPLHDCHELAHAGEGAACHAAFAGCIRQCLAAIDAAEGGPGEEPSGSPYCAALGELCHVVDDQSGPLHECHEVGHEGGEASCLAEFDGCADDCLAARGAEATGAGGAGG